MISESDSLEKSSYQKDNSKELKRKSLGKSDSQSK